MSYRPARFKKMLNDFDWRDGSLLLMGGGGGRGELQDKLNVCLQGPASQA